MVLSRIIVWSSKNVEGEDEYVQFGRRASNSRACSWSAATILCTVRVGVALERSDARTCGVEDQGTAE